MKRVGFWGSGNLFDIFFARIIEKQVAVHPLESVDEHWLDTPAGKKQYKAVVQHLQDGKASEAYYGWETCRICGNAIGTKDMTDDEYLWPEGYLHYITVHHVKPPQEFIEHCLRMQGNFIVMYGAPF